MRQNYMRKLLLRLHKIEAEQLNDKIRLLIKHSSWNKKGYIWFCIQKTLVQRTSILYLSFYVFFLLPVSLPLCHHIVAILVFSAEAVASLDSQQYPRQQHFAYIFVGKLIRGDSGRKEMESSSLESF